MLRRYHTTIRRPAWNLCGDLFPTANEFGIFKILKISILTQHNYSLILYNPIQIFKQVILHKTYILIENLHKIKNLNI